LFGKYFGWVPNVYQQLARCVMDTASREVYDSWNFWSDALDRPDAPQLVTRVIGARVALHLVQAHGFPSEEMHQWVEEWATPSGLKLFAHECGTAKSFCHDDKHRCVGRWSLHRV
jgi:hypothetical protein